MFLPHWQCQDGHFLWQKQSWQRDKGSSSSIPSDLAVYLPYSPSHSNSWSLPDHCLDQNLCLKTATNWAAGKKSRVDACPTFCIVSGPHPRSLPCTVRTRALERHIATQASYCDWYEQGVMVAVQWAKISLLARSRTVHFALQPPSWCLRQYRSNSTILSSVYIINILHLLTTIAVIYVIIASIWI